VGQSAANETIGETVHARPEDSAWRQRFSVLELMVVVVIIGVLLAAAVVTFLGARERAADTSAKSRVSDALKAQRVVFLDGNGFTEDSVVLKQVEPNLDFVDDAVVLGAVSVNVDGDTVTLASRSSSGTCYWLRDTVTGTEYAAGACSLEPAALASLAWGDGW